MSHHPISAATCRRGEAFVGSGTMTRTPASWCAISVLCRWRPLYSHREQTTVSIVARVAISPRLPRSATGRPGPPGRAGRRCGPTDTRRRGVPLFVAGSPPWCILSMEGAHAPRRRRRVRSSRSCCGLGKPAFAGACVVMASRVVPDASVAASSPWTVSHKTDLRIAERCTRRQSESGRIAVRASCSPQSGAPCYGFWRPGPDRVFASRQRANCILPAASLRS